ncbi:hypothetical protein AB0I53_35835 [Saccharopolyspora sp. NPDC050389]|uniref:hypothetical protein n=1 Tax=Saccharopolyspora sp. NPDC050389 TaxID=3155516 RepID=UPI0033F976E3
MDSTGKGVPPRGAVSDVPEFLRMYSGEGAIPGTTSPRAPSDEVAPSPPEEQ